MNLGESLQVCDKWFNSETKHAGAFNFVLSTQLWIQPHRPVVVCSVGPVLDDQLQPVNIPYIDFDAAQNVIANSG